MGVSTMRLLIFLLVTTFIITTFSKRPSWRPIRPWSQGRKCSNRVKTLCKSKLKECVEDGNECENRNKNNPKKGKVSNRYRNKYCKNVLCVQSVGECTCPMDHEPVCDDDGTLYDNVDCAVCSTGKSREEFSLDNCDLGIGVIGTEGPLF